MAIGRISILSLIVVFCTFFSILPQVLSSGGLANTNENAEHLHSLSKRGDVAYQSRATNQLNEELTSTKAVADNASAVKQSLPLKISAAKVRKDMWIAYRLANAVWIDKAAAADPSIVEAICAHPGPARILAKNHRIAEVAEADHYLCRRLTRWKGATWALVHNRYADKVILLDPEGIYRAINRNPTIARVLSRHVMFNQIVVENPDLGKFVALHM